jgi:hypothetical protein
MPKYYLLTREDMSNDQIDKRYNWIPEFQRISKRKSKVNTTNRMRNFYKESACLLTTYLKYSPTRISHCLLLSKIHLKVLFLPQQIWIERSSYFSADDWHCRSSQRPFGFTFCLKVNSNSIITSIDQRMDGNRIWKSCIYFNEQN